VIEQLARRGYGYGSGMLSPDCSQFIVSMPKNASSYLVDWAGRHGWSSAVVGDSCSWHLVQEMIVVLRDPLDRWISGIAQYLNTYILNVTGPNGPIYKTEDMTAHDHDMTAGDWIKNYNQNSERLIFDVISKFDDHTWPQHEFFENLLPAVNRQYFYLNKNFDTQIINHLRFKNCNDLDRNQGADHVRIKQLQEFFRHRLNIRPELADRVKSHYYKDYEYIQAL